MSNLRIRCYSPHAPAKCAELLAGAVDVMGPIKGNFSHFFGRRPVIGSISHSSLRLRKRIRGRNSFQYFLAAELLSKDSGTLIQGGFQFSRFVVLLTLTWFILVLGFGIVNMADLMTDVFNDEKSVSQDWPVLLFFPLMLVGGSFVVWVGQHVARHEPAYLRDFLVKTLDARLIDTVEHAAESP